MSQLPSIYRLTHTILIPNISHFVNSVDPEQLASEKPADQDLHCFHSACKYIHIAGLQQVNLVGEGSGRV